VLQNKLTGRKKPIGFGQSNLRKAPEPAKNKHGAEGEAGRRGAYMVVREHRTASLTKPGVVLQRSPRVVVSGYYGFGNCGDEAMLFAIVTQLKKRMPALEVVVLSRRPEDTARDFGVEAIPRRDFRLIWRELKKADLLLSGGGSLFQDVTSPRNVFYYAAIIIMAKLLGRRICLYGQGLGPLKRRISRYLVRRVANWADVITLRDEGSLEELRALGVGRRVFVTTDPVLGLEAESADRERGRALLAAAGIETGPESSTPAPGDEAGRRREQQQATATRSPLAGVSLRPWPHLRQSVTAVAQTADRMKAQGWQVVLIPLQASDLQILNQVRETMRQPAVILENIRGFRDLMAVMAHLDFGLGMRLHFLIFAALFGVPAVGLGYDPKVGRFMDQIGLPAIPLAEVNEEVLSRTAGGLLDSLDATRAQVGERVRQLKARAEANADLVADLLSKTGRRGIS
jgi:polysaccharide pyruvyl transferase CsaB